MCFLCEDRSLPTILGLDPSGSSSVPAPAQPSHVPQLRLPDRAGASDVALNLSAGTVREPLLQVSVGSVPPV